MQSTRSTLFLICAMILWLLCIQCSGLKQRFARVVRAEKFTRIGMVKSKSTVQCLDLLNYVEENAMGTFEEYREISSVHVVQEALPYRRRSAADLAVVAALKDRVMMRAYGQLKFSAEDKMNNPLVALPATTGLGKSTTLVHLPFSPEFKIYAKYRQTLANTDVKTSTEPPLVSIFTFNSKMGYLPGLEVVGLRIIYGVLCFTSKTEAPPHWPSFLEQFKHHQKLNAPRAVELLRSVFGKDRHILIGVDELAKVAKRRAVDSIMTQLGYLLNEDGRTDIVVSALTPKYAKDLVTGSNRPIRYALLPPLNSGELHDEFTIAVTPLVETIKEKCQRSGWKLDPFNEHLLQSMDLLASGHPRTVEILIQKVKSESMYDVVESLLTDPKADSLQLLDDLSAMPEFSMYSEVPENGKECEILLSTCSWDVVQDKRVRLMLEKNQCLLFKRPHTYQNDLTTTSYRITACLGTFFRMIRAIKDNGFGRKEGLPLCRAAETLFGSERDNQVRLSSLWENSRALTLVSRVNERLRSKTATASFVLGIRDNLDNFQVKLKSDILVVLTEDENTTSMIWKENTLLVPPHNQAGFDLLLCLNSAEDTPMYIYEEVKIMRPKKKTKSPEMGTKSQQKVHRPLLEEVGEVLIELEFPADALKPVMAGLGALLGDKLHQTLEDHVQRCGLSSMPPGEQLVGLKNVIFVLSVYGTEWEKNQQEVLDYLDELAGKASSSNKKASVELTRRFVQEYWDHVAFTGTEEMDKAMVPVLLPIAQLVQALHVVE